MRSRFRNFITRPGVESGMLERWRGLVYAWAFYLPNVRGELSLFDTQEDRNRARLHVWRILFRSWRYWWLCFLTTATMVASMAAPLIFSPSLRIAFGRQNAIAERLAIFVYFIGLALSFTIIGMLPLRRMILRQLRTHMNERGIVVCIGCGYDLRGSISARCPECGEAPASASIPANASK